MYIVQWDLGFSPCHAIVGTLYDAESLARMLKAVPNADCTARVCTHVHWNVQNIRYVSLDVFDHRTPGSPDTDDLRIRPSGSALSPDSPVVE